MGCIVHGVAKSQTQLSDFHFHFPFFPIIKEVRDEEKKLKRP